MTSPSDDEVGIDVTLDVDTEDLGILSQVAERMREVRTELDASRRSAHDLISEISRGREFSVPVRVEPPEAPEAPDAQAGGGGDRLPPPPPPTTPSAAPSDEPPRKRDAINTPERAEGLPGESETARRPRFESEPEDLPGTGRQRLSVAEGADLLASGAELLAPGGDIVSKTQGASAFLSRAGGMLGGSSALGGAAGALGTAAGGLAGAAAVGVAAQKLGEGYQQYRDLGSIQGGDGAEGFAYQMGIYQMATSPFLTSQQSREIVMSALSEGYTGKEFDTVTDFMAKNLREMNMSVADSTKVLQKSVGEGGQSIAELSRDLEVLKSTTKGSVDSLSERQERYTQNVSTLVDRGMEGSKASSLALAYENVFSDNRTLSGLSTTFASNTDPRMIRAMGRNAGITGSTDAIMMQLQEDPEAWIQSQGALFSKLYEQSQAAKNEPERKARFHRLLKTYGFNLNPGDSLELYKQFESGEGQKAFSGSFEEQEKAQNEAKRLGFEGLMAEQGAGGPFSNITTDIAYGWNKIQEGWDTMFGDEEGAQLNREQAEKNRRDHHNFYARRLQSQAGVTYSAQLRALMEEYGANNIEYVDENGKRQKLTAAPLTKEQIEEGKFSINGGKAKLARDLNPTGLGSDSSGTSSTSVKIDLTDEARRLLRVTETSNQSRARAGVPGARTNNAPVGDK